MKPIFLVANWKSNKTIKEVLEWFSEIKSITADNNKKIIICPPFTTLETTKRLIDENSLPFEIGSQNISAFNQGAYTGEINSTQVKDFANYVIIGHSERRENQKEDDLLLSEKTDRAKEGGLKVIYCIQGAGTVIPENVDVIAYEPVFAIGTGTPDTPENAEKVAKELKKRFQKPFLYGGSVTAENIRSYTSKEEIDGALIGGASLDPHEFGKIINLA